MDKKIVISIPFTTNEIVVKGKEIDKEKALDFLQSLEGITDWEQKEKWFKDNIKEGKLYWDPCG
jgi:hypothetical protein